MLISIFTFIIHVFPSDTKSNTYVFLVLKVITEMFSLGFPENSEGSVPSRETPMGANVA